MAATPTIAAIAAAVKAELDTVPGVGKVLARPRDAIRPEDVDALFVDATSGTVRAWIIDIIGSNAEEDPAGNLFITTRTLRVEGFLTFDQENDSAADFRALVDAVQSKINRNAAIFGACPLVADTGTTITIDHAKLGEILCHHAVIEAQVESQEVLS